VRSVETFLSDVDDGGALRPRFEYVSTGEMYKLSHDAQAAARTFLLTQARPLEQALYRWEFENGSEDEVYMALNAYANADGGFGRALEPDLRSPDSSILATSTALQTLRRIDAPAGHELVQGAVRYLRDTFDVDNIRWPLISPTANNAPHAPWWTVGPEHPGLFREYAVNPRAELLGVLYHYRDLADEGILTAVERALLFHYRSLSQALDMNEVLCTIRLIETEETPDDVRAAAREAVVRSLPETMARETEAWESYSLQPLAVADSPDAALAADVADLIPANLDFRIDEQEADGSWAPSWSWGDLYPETWPEARRNWQGVLTLEALRQTAAYGRWAV
jgi:hypothetical protein